MFRSTYVSGLGRTLVATQDLPRGATLFEREPPLVTYRRGPQKDACAQLFENAWISFCSNHVDAETKKFLLDFFHAGGVPSSSTATSSTATSPSTASSSSNEASLSPSTPLAPCTPSAVFTPPPMTDRLID
ncbi:unnamed protein product, partial [Amoebophrya sp. A25]|eukprot:GSA25T00006983001.1